MEQNQIRDAYVTYVLENGERPKSLYAFAKSIKISEADLYKFYTSFDAIDQDVWLTMFTDTHSKLEKDKTYKKYNASEKLLGFYYTWIETLKNNRSFILHQREHLTANDIRGAKLEPFRKAFYDYANEIIEQGIAEKLIQERKFVSDKYAHGLWAQTLFILNYWVKDTSANFENTDAAIEKTVNLGLSLVRENALDNIIDFGKFVMQSR